MLFIVLGLALGCDSGSGGGTSKSGGSPGGSGGSVGSGGGQDTGGTLGVGGMASGGAGSGGVAGAAGSGTGGGSPSGGSKGPGGIRGTGGATVTAGSVGGRGTGGMAGLSGGTTGPRPSGTGGAATGGKGGGGSGAAGATTGGSKGTAGVSVGGGAGAGGATGTGGTTSTGKEYWIASDGSDTAAGTEAAPWKTLSYAHGKASAGVTVWVKPGTYAWSSTVSLSKSGSEGSPIKVFATEGARPVFDFSGQPRDDSSSRGIKISGDYWHIKGIDVINAGDNCINISGSHNTIEWVVVRGCCDTGLQISADSSQASDSSRAAYNTIVNCDSYENYDKTTNGENADGFAPKLHIGPGNVFRGCRSWNNADDGWDLFASDDVVVIENCWAFLNGKLASGGGTSAGDGNGFKLGGAAASGDAYEGGAPHQVKNCFAFENLACGYTRNNNTDVPVLTSCGGRDDGKGEYCSLSNPSPVSFTMTGAQAKAVKRNADGSLPSIQ